MTHYTSSPILNHCTKIVLFLKHFRYKKLWAKHQKSKRKLPDWQTALSFRNIKSQNTSPTLQRSSASPSSVLTISRSSSSSSDSALASPMESFPHDIYQIIEESENHDHFDADDENTDDSTSILSLF